jgi:cytochrome c
MFDTMTLTKVVGGFCGALLVFLLGNWAAELIYAGPESHGEEVEQAYLIDTGATETAGDGGAEQVDFQAIMASADPSKGERVFTKCKACHKVDGTNATGPYLNGVVGRPVDAVEGYAYSGALEEVVDVWTPEHLQAFLENPRGYAPGTKMGFSGLPKIEDRANLIAYLESLGG